MDTSHPIQSTAIRHWLPRVRSLLQISAITALLSLSGCAIPIPAEGDTRRHVIIGFGIVTVNDADSHTAVATSTKSLGLHVTNLTGTQAVLGYGSSKQIIIAEDASVIVDVAHAPTGEISIIAQAVEEEGE